MTDLILRMTGEIAESNFDEWKLEVLENIRAADRDLVTEEDFVLADETITAIKGYEKAIEEAKEKAQRGTEGLATMFAAVDEIKEQLETTRLALEEKVRAKRLANEKAAKEKRVAFIEKLVNDSVADILVAVNTAVPRGHFGTKDMTIDREALLAATKSKKTEEGMERAVFALVNSMSAAHIEKIRAANRRMDTLIEKELSFPGAFHDKRGLAWSKTDGELESIIEARMATYRLQQKEKEERESRTAAQAGQSGQTGAMSRPSTSSLLFNPPRSSAQPSEPPPQVQAQMQQQPPQPGPGSEPAPTGEQPPVAADFVFTVLLACDVDTAKELAKELAAYFGRRKEIVKFYLKRA